MAKHPWPDWPNRKGQIGSRLQTGKATYTGGGWHKLCMSLQLGALGTFDEAARSGRGMAMGVYMCSASRGVGPASDKITVRYARGLLPNTPVP